MRLNLVAGVFFFGSIAVSLPVIGGTIFDDQGNGAPAATAPATAPAASPRTAPTTRSRSVKQSKIAPPTGSDLSNAQKLVDELYADESAKAHSNEEKSTLANKLLQDAIDEKFDQSGKYVLFRKAIDESTSVGDLTTAARAIAEMSTVFQVDGAKLTRDAAAVTSSKLATDPQRRTFADQAESLAGDAQAANEFALAKYLDSLALSAATNAGDPKLVSEMTSVSAQHVEMTEAYSRIKPAEQTLKTKPDDAHANLEVGKYLCFYAGDWDRGLPMLAKGSDGALRAVAKIDLIRSFDPGERLAIADGWWDAAATLSRNSKSNCQNRAAAFYERLLPVIGGLSKIKVEKRLAQLESRPITGVINLLDLVDIRADSSAGNWILFEGKLKSDGGKLSLIEFRYEPPKEYDYEVSFKRTAGDDCIYLIATAYGKQFTWTVSASSQQTVFGFVGGPINHSLPIMFAGKKYTLVIKVRYECVSVYMGADLLDIVFKEDLKDNNNGLNHTTTLGVGTGQTPSMLFSVAKVTPVTGRGRVIAVGAGSGDK